MPVPKGIRLGGRQKGTKNKATVEKEAGHAEIVKAAASEGETPLQYMLRVMRTSGDEKRRDAMAVAAAPFLHAKLASVEHSGSMTFTHEDSLRHLERETEDGPALHQ